jgi:hypothetical protein
LSAKERKDNSLVDSIKNTFLLYRLEGVLDDDEIRGKILNFQLENLEDRYKALERHFGFDRKGRKI